MNFEIDESAYAQIAELIHSDNSPVGIDAKKPHILILYQLQKLNERVQELEEEVKRLSS